MTATGITSQADTNFTAITVPADGNIIWSVLCNDSAGQETWFSDNYTLNVDATNPSVT